MDGKGRARNIGRRYGELEFVNLCGTSRNSRQKAKAVRSHAMRFVRKKRSERTPTRTRILTSKSHGGSLPQGQQYFSSDMEISPGETSGLLPKLLAYDETSGWFCSGENKAYGTNLSISRSQEASIFASRSYSSPYTRRIPIAPITFGASDPFNAFPIPFTPRIHQLLHFTIVNRVRTSVHEDPHHAFSSGVGSNMALLHTSLSFAAAHLGVGEPDEIDESWSYLQSAVAYINRDLAASANSAIAIEDATVAAVACLSNIETLNGDMSKALIHMRGLKAIVEEKGGVQSLGMNGTLRRLVLWADLCNATRWNSAPIFPPADFPSIFPHSLLLPSTVQTSTLALRGSLLSSSMIAGVSALSDLLQDLHALALFLDRTDPRDVDILHDVAYADRACLVEYQTLMMTAQYINPPVHSKEMVLPLLFQALLLYIYTNIRLTPVGSNLRSAVIGRIKQYVSSIPNSTLKDLVTDFPNEMLWLFFLTGSSAVESESRWFFKSNLVWICMSQGLASWGGVNFQLKRFLWLRTSCLERCFVLCKEVLQHQSS